MTDWKERPSTSEIRLYRGDDVFEPPTRSQLEEDHHHFYGRPWYLGRCNFEDMLRFGLNSKSKILDFGCGAGRLAVWLIQYLDSGNYFGVEAHEKSVAALMQYEIPLHGIAYKKACISLDSELNIDVFGVKFDFIIDAYSSIHLDKERLALFRKKISASLSDDGKYIVCPAPIKVDEAPFYSMELESTLLSRCVQLSRSEKSADTDWYLYKKI